MTSPDTKNLVDTLKELQTYISQLDRSNLLYAVSSILFILASVFIRARYGRKNRTSKTSTANTNSNDHQSQSRSTNRVKKSSDNSSSAASIYPGTSATFDFDTSNIFLPRVAIIGGGLSGLSAALSLQRVGIPCTVYERDTSLDARRGGYGLTLTNNPVGALAELDVLQDCIREDCVSTAHWVLKPNGQILGYYGRGLQEESEVATSSTSPSPSPSPSPSMSPSPSDSPASLRIPREDLRRMLYSRLQPNTVEWGCKLKDYVEDFNTPASVPPVTLTFEDGRQVKCDLLVGADGIHSIVRKLRDAKQQQQHQHQGVPASEGASSLNYLQVAVILGTSTHTHPLLNARGIYVVDGRTRLFTMPFRSAIYDEHTGRVLQPQQTMWQLSFRCENEADAKRLRQSTPETMMSYALELTDGWMAPVRDMITSTEPIEVWSTPLYDRDPMPLRAKTQTRNALVTVMGDAAHPMSMFKGSGANQALQDGPTLAQWLRYQHSSRKDTPAARSHYMTRDSLISRVRQYERDMVQRSSPRVLDSRKAASWYHSELAATIGVTYGLGNKIGVRPGEPTVIEVLKELERRQIRASENDGIGLEEKVRQVMKEMRDQITSQEDENNSSKGKSNRRRFKTAVD